MSLGVDRPEEACADAENRGRSIGSSSYTRELAARRQEQVAIREAEQMKVSPAAGRTPPVTLGIDVANATLEAALEVDGQVVALGSFANAAAGWETLRVRVQTQVGRPTTADERCGVLLVLEPTGGYELGVAVWAHAQPGWMVVGPIYAWCGSGPARKDAGRKRTDKMPCCSLTMAPTRSRPPGAPAQ